MGSKLLTFVKDNLLGLLGLVFGLIGIVLAIYFYTLSLAERQPILSIAQPRTLVADTQRTATSKIKVVRADGRPVAGQVWAVRFYLWNPGKLSVKKEHVLKPIALEFTDAGVEILDYAIVHENRPEISRAKLKVGDSAQHNRVQVDFDILENTDVIAGQVIYRGSADTPIAVRGAVEGVREVRSEAPVDWSSVWGNFFYAIIYLGGFLVVSSVVLTGVFLLIEKAGATLFKGMSEDTKKRIKKYSDLAVPIIGVGIFLLFLFALVYQRSKPIAPVPVEITKTK